MATFTSTRVGKMAEDAMCQDREPDEWDNVAMKACDNYTFSGAVCGVQSLCTR